MKNKFALLFIVLVMFITLIACNTNLKDVEKLELTKDSFYQVFTDETNHIKLRLLPADIDKGLVAGFHVIGPETATTASVTIPHYTSMYTNSFPIVAIKDKAFFDNTVITSVNFDSTNTHIKTIGNYAFSGCTQINTEIQVPVSVTTIGNGAFYNCTSYNKSFAIPDNIVTIGDSAFQNTPITGVLNLKNVKIVGKNAFNGCHCQTIEITPVKGETIIHSNAMPFNLIQNSDKISIKTNEATIPNDAANSTDWGWANDWTSNFSKVSKGSL